MRVGRRPEASYSLNAPVIAPGMPWKAIVAIVRLRPASVGDCPNFRVSENGTVPFAVDMPRLFCVVH